MVTIRKSTLVCLVFSVSSSLSSAGGVMPSYDKRELLAQLIVLNDEHVPIELARQLTEIDQPYHGAVYDADSVVSPIRTAMLIQTLMCSYVSRDSKYYHSQEILHRMTLAANALVRLQHEDGTIDLVTTNFHSTPDLGFTIYPLALSYSIMLKNKHLKYGEFQSPMKKYLLNAGEALSRGGIHTPNHRWVVSGALAWLYTFFPDPKYKARIGQWLAEKIDIDPDGQYHERSTSIYTPVTNRSILDVAQKMKYDYLFDVVRRNLDMTFFFVHANGEIATEASRRQDKYVRSNMGKYYLAYNYMALLDGDSHYSGMVHYIQSTVPVADLIYMLPLFLDDSNLLKDLPEPAPIPISYHKHFKYSDMVRIRDGEVDMSIITNNTTFFTFFKGEAALEGVRLSSAFFGKGQFQAQQLEQEGGTYILSSAITGPYYQPLPKEKIPEDGDAWNKVPRTEREQSEVQTLSTKVYVTPSPGGARIKVSVEGPANLPVTLELGFRTGGQLENITQKQGIDNAFLARNGEYITYRSGDDRIKIGPGVHAHNWTQLRGALEKLQADCLYFTAYAPCDFEFTIE